MSRRINSVQQRARNSSERIDHWLHAMALLTVRRQMRGKWTRRYRSSCLPLP
jgi:hypothetical protein